MRKRCSVLIMIMILLLCSSGSSFACDDKQTDTYVNQILFGDEALSKATNNNVEKLHNALYLCSEQCDGQGQDKIDFLNSQKVSGVPDLEKIDIKSDNLPECSHKSWEFEYDALEKEQAARKKVLQKTVNDIFDFGFFSNHFGSSKGKCNSFAALLYYSHILSDYLADSPTNTEVDVNGKVVPAYSGATYTTINGNKPSFTSAQKKSTNSFVLLSELDKNGRAGVAFANVGPDIMPPSSSRQEIGMITPSGWNQKRYDDILGTDKSPGYLYQRCHLIAHQLIGGDVDKNLITGTRYLNNNGMKPFEDDVANYIRSTNNHVLYRATPVFQGENKLAHGVQIEAYSVEDNGKGICCNRYYYNVQPGIELNYANGDNCLLDTISNSDNVIPFAVENASENNPDLIYEVNKHLEVLFEDQKDSNTYKLLMDNIKTVADESRAIKEDNPAKKYILLKKYEYKYLDILKTSVPLLLNKEEFFNSAFE